MSRRGDNRLGASQVSQDAARDGERPASAAAIDPDRALAAMTGGALHPAQCARTRQGASSGSQARGQLHERNALPSCALLTRGLLKAA
jgi:hypothetical protein